MTTAPHPTARARRSFWTLVVIAALSMGALSAALKAHPSPVTGAAVAVSGAVLAISLTLAARVLLALDHARRSSAGAAGNEPVVECLSGTGAGAGGAGPRPPAPANTRPGRDAGVKAPDSWKCHSRHGQRPGRDRTRHAGHPLRLRR